MNKLQRKIVSVLFLSLGSASRKSLTDKYPELRVATISLKGLKDNCEQPFIKPRNRTLERYKFFARKQAPKETLRQFWHTLTGIAAKCAFREQTESLIMDTFIQNMNNKMIQRKLCTETKDNPQKAFRFAVAYEESGSKVEDAKHSKVEDAKIKTNQCTQLQKNNACTRRGLEFSQNYLALGKAKNEKRRNCATIGHYARMCKRPKNGNVR